LIYYHFYVVVAAGNEDNDACKVSPASANGVLTVMASDRDDTRAYFSNYGKCADIYAPGVDIESSIPNGRTAVYSGTSMACPAVAGVLNHYIDMYPELNMKQLRDKLIKDSNKGMIKNNKRGTGDYLVYIDRHD
jgi:subtilisin family serine protease